MSDDRTLEPSPQRLREARERGMVPNSAELTAAVAVLAIVAALGGAGEALAEGIVRLMKGTLAGDDPGHLLADPRAFVDLVRSSLGAVAAPLTLLLAAPALAALIAHQIQLGGLFVPSLALPDPARLRPGALGGSPADRFGRALGTLLRGILLVVLAWWTIRTIRQDFASASSASTAADPAAMLRSLAVPLHSALFRLGLALLAVGLIHYAIQYRRLHARLRMTPEERREEQRSQDGDPSLRSQRRAARDRRLMNLETSSASPPEAI